jgi:hypothetical protein
MTRAHFAEGQVLFREGIRRTVFFASSAVPSTYSGNSMATPSFSARLAQGSLSGRWALWKTAPAMRPLEPPARSR